MMNAWIKQASFSQKYKQQTEDPSIITELSSITTIQEFMKRNVKMKEFVSIYLRLSTKAVWEVIK